MLIRSKRTLLVVAGLLLGLANARDARAELGGETEFPHYVVAYQAAAGAAVQAPANALDDKHFGRTEAQVEFRLANDAVRQLPLLTISYDMVSHGIMKTFEQRWGSLSAAERGATMTALVLASRNTGLTAGQRASLGASEDARAALVAALRGNRLDPQQQQTIETALIGALERGDLSPHQRTAVGAARATFLADIEPQGNTLELISGPLPITVRGQKDALHAIKDFGDSIEAVAGTQWAEFAAANKRSFVDRFTKVVRLTDVVAEYNRRCEARGARGAQFAIAHADDFDHIIIMVWDTPEPANGQGNFGVPLTAFARGALLQDFDEPTDVRDRYAAEVDGAQTFLERYERLRDLHNDLEVRAFFIYMRMLFWIEGEGSVAGRDIVWKKNRWGNLPKVTLREVFDVLPAEAQTAIDAWIEHSSLDDLRAAICGDDARCRARIATKANLTGGLMSAERSARVIQLDGHHAIVVESRQAPLAIAKMFYLTLHNGHWRWDRRALTTAVGRINAMLAEDEAQPAGDDEPEE